MHSYSQFHSKSRNKGKLMSIDNRQPYDILDRKSNRLRGDFRITLNSKKDRIQHERQQEIQRDNLILYEKIQKIMLVNEKNKKQIKDSVRQSTLIYSTTPKVRKSYMDTHRTRNSSGSSNSQFPSLKLKKNNTLGHIQPNSNNSEEEFIPRTRQENKFLGEFQCFGWKIIVKTIEYGEFLRLQGHKGRRKIIKNFHYPKAKQKINSEGLQAWVSSKYQYEI